MRNRVECPLCTSNTTTSKVGGLFSIVRISNCTIVFAAVSCGLEYLEIPLTHSLLTCQDRLFSFGS
jgi:hypothetical protein